MAGSILGEEINNWIVTLDSGEEVSLASLNEFINKFNDINFIEIIPFGLNDVENINITNISVGYFDDLISIQNLSITFTSETKWDVNSEYHGISDFEVKLDFRFYNNQYEIFNGYIKGKLYTNENNIVIPAAFYKTESGWKAILEAELSDPASLTFEQLKYFIDEPGVDDEIPEMLLPLESITISKIEMVFSDNMCAVNSKLFVLKIDDILLSDFFPVGIKNTELVCDMTTTLENEVTEISLEGNFYAGALVLPKVKTSFSSEENNKLKIRMIDNEYTIGRISDLKDLLNGTDLEGFLLPGMPQFSGVKLTHFTCDIDYDDGVFDYLGLTIETPEDNENGWNIIPGILSMRNVSIDFSLPSLNLTFKGIIGVGSHDVPMMVSIDLSNETMPDKILLKVDKEFYEQDWSMPISFDGLAIGNFELNNILPGLNDLELSLEKLGFEFLISESLLLKQFEFFIKSESYWSILPGIEIGEFALNLNCMFNDQLETDSFETELYGILKVNVENSDPIPIKLLVNSKNNWIVELCDDNSNGVLLPGLESLTGLTGFNLPGILPNFLTLEGLCLIDLNLVFNPSESKLYSAFLEVSMKDVLSFGSFLKLKELKFQIDADYTIVEPKYNGSFACMLELGDITMPLFMPLPFNSQDWTIQLYDNAYIPSLSYFTELLGFDGNQFLSDIGLPEIPAIIVSRFDLKFDIEPFELTKSTVSVNFDESITLNLPPGIEVRLDSLNFEMDSSTGSFEISHYQLNGAITESIGSSDTEILVTITKSGNTWILESRVNQEDSFAISFGFLKKLLPGCLLPSSLENFKIDFHSIYMRMVDGFNLEEFYVVSNIENINSLSPLNIFADTIGFKAIYEEEDGLGRFGFQLLDWPFSIGHITYLQKEGWILVDLHEFGSLTMEIPKLFFEGENLLATGIVEASHDGEEIILQNGDVFIGKGLNIPIEYILNKINLSIFNKILPESIPLTPSVDLRSLIESGPFNGNADNLPDSFKPYLDIQFPDKIEYEFFIGTKNEISFNLKLPDVDNLSMPNKMLVTDGINVTGIKLYKIGFTLLMGFPFLNIDIEIDTFLLPVLVALTKLPSAAVDKLPVLKDTNFHLNLKDVWLVLSTYIPIPLFYDEISFYYTGPEGVKMGTGVQLPKPGVSVKDYSKIIDFVVQLKRFFTERDYYLNPQDLGESDLTFSFAPTYADMPGYLGSQSVGTHDSFASLSVSTIIAETLNTFKNPSLSRFIKLIPTKYRRADIGINFFFLNTALSIGISTPLEFVKDNPVGLSDNTMRALFPDVVIADSLSSGNEDLQLASPKSYIKCSENSGSVLNDSLSNLQLVAEDGKILNWKKENILGYENRAYIQGGNEGDLTGIVSGDIIENKYDEYTISILLKVLPGDTGCILSTSGDLSLWMLNGQIDTCGGVSLTADDLIFNSWFRMTIVQTVDTQSIYINQKLCTENSVYQNIGSGKFILGALNENYVSELLPSKNTYTGAYTGLLVYDRSLKTENIVALCEYDISDHQLSETINQDEDERILALIAGRWDIGFIESEIMLGFSFKDFSGAGLHMALNGNIGDNFIGFNFSGLFQVDLEAAVSDIDKLFLIDLKGNFYFMGRDIIKCQVTLSPEQFFIMGVIDLFDWPWLSLKGDVTGYINRHGDFQLSSDAEFKIAGIEVFDSSTLINNNSIIISGTLLGCTLVMNSHFSSGNYYLKGGISFDYGFSFETGSISIPTPFGDVKIASLDLNLSVSCSLNLKISHSGVDIKLEFGFTVFGKSYSLELSLDSLLTSLDEIKDLIKNAIINFVKDMIFSVPAALQNFIAWAKVVWSKMEDYVEKVSQALKDGFNKTFDEIGDALRLEFDFDYVDVAKGLKKVGATAVEVGKILTHFDCSAISSVLQGAEFATDAINDAMGFIKCPIDGWVCVDCCVKVCCVKW